MLRRRAAERGAQRRRSTDEGSSLVIVMAFIMIGAMFVLPMMQYAVSVTRAGSSQQDKITRAERKEMRAAAEKLPEKYRQ